MNYDGTIRINTQLDTKSFNDGVKNITGSVGKLVDTVKGFGNIWLALIAGRTIFDSLLAGLSQFNLLWSPMGKQVWDLSWAFQNLQGAWANLIATAIEPMIPYIIQIVHWLTGLVQYVTVLIAAFFGLDKTMGNIMKKTDTLAAFDKINTLSNQFGPPSSPAPITVPDSLLKQMDELKKKIAELLAPLMNVWNQFLVPFGQWIQNVALPWLIDQLNKLADWAVKNPATFDTIVSVFTLIALAVLAITFPLVAISLLIGLIIVLVILLVTRWNQLSTTVSQLGAVFVYAIMHPLDAIHDKFMTILLVATIVIAGIILLVAGVPLAIVAGVMIVIAAIGLIITHFGGIKDFFKGLANDIIWLFNQVINSFARTINNIASIDNVLFSFVPGYKPLGQIQIPRIPYLATGAVIPPNSKFLAMLGDQSSGRNIEAPESLIRQIMAEELSKQSITINATGSLSQLIKMLKLELDKENVRTGNNLVKRTGQVPIS